MSYGIKTQMCSSSCTAAWLGRRLLCFRETQSHVRTRIAGVISVIAKLLTAASADWKILSKQSSVYLSCCGGRDSFQVTGHPDTSGNVGAFWELWSSKLATGQESHMSQTLSCFMLAVGMLVQHDPPLQRIFSLSGMYMHMAWTAVSMS